MISPTILALTLLLPIVQAAAGAVASPATVPSATLTAAKADPLRFVMQLVEAGVPAGLEIRAADRQRAARSATKWNQTRVPRERIGFEDLVPTTQLLTLFNSGRSDYQAALVEGVVVVRPTRDRAAYLDGAASFPDIDANNLFEALKQVFAPLDPSLVARGSSAGSLLSPIGADVDRGASLKLNARSDGKLVIDVLNDFASKAAGHAWLVTTDDEGTITQVGAVHQYGTTTERPIGNR
jgi:hypothetical protein